MSASDNTPMVRISHTMGKEEQQFVTERKKMIQRWLRHQGIDCELDEVPNIALLGSGGGERAAVGLLGSVQQLLEDDMLDSILYMAGVSGSTWCMSSLYKNPKWSWDNRWCLSVIERLKGEKISIHQVVSELRDVDDPDFNLTHMWAALTTSRVMKEMNRSHLSNQADWKPINPYPIYSTIELDMSKHGKKRETWFELTPHESGFSGLGAYVNTSSLRSHFEAGELKWKKPEVDMVLLQGMCGSAIADRERNIQEVKNLIIDFLGKYKSYLTNMLPSGSSPAPENSQQPQMSRMMTMETEMKECSCLPSQVLPCVIQLLELTEEPGKLEESDEVMKLCSTVSELLDVAADIESTQVWRFDDAIWNDSSVKEREEYIMELCQELIGFAETWASKCNNPLCDHYAGDNQMVMSRMILSEGTGFSAPTPQTNSYSSMGNTYWVLKTLGSLIHRGEWGTTSNFLYRYQNPNVPSRLRTKQKVHLIDAGLLINSPYPPVLRPEREVDLIISLDFSAGDPFETVLLAKDYAEELDLPFPRVDESFRKDADCPQDCYIFEGQPGEPTVIHVPLFNLQNCEDGKDLEKEKEEYGTFQKPYSPDMIAHLLEKAGINMRNNRDRILYEIKKAVERKRKPLIARAMDYTATMNNQEFAKASACSAPEQLYLRTNVTRPAGSDSHLTMEETSYVRPHTTAQRCQGIRPERARAMAYTRTIKTQETAMPTESSVPGGQDNPAVNLTTSLSPEYRYMEESLPVRPPTTNQGPPGYYLMPIGYNPCPMGPISMPYPPGPTGWSWGAYQPPQQPAQSTSQSLPMAPPPGPVWPVCPMPFPGYYLLPMGPPSHLEPYNSTSGPSY